MLLSDYDDFLFDESDFGRPSESAPGDAGAAVTLILAPFFNF
jgi:hypothetical protein